MWNLQDMRIIYKYKRHHKTLIIIKYPSRTTFVVRLFLFGFFYDEIVRFKLLIGVSIFFFISRLVYNYRFSNIKVVFFIRWYFIGTPLTPRDNCLRFFFYFFFYFTNNQNADEHFKIRFEYSIAFWFCVFISTTTIATAKKKYLSSLINFQVLLHASVVHK